MQTNDITDEQVWRYATLLSLYNDIKQNIMTETEKMTKSEAYRYKRNVLLAEYFHKLVADGYSKMRAYELAAARYHLSVNRAMRIINKK